MNIHGYKLIKKPKGTLGKKFFRVVDLCKFFRVVDLSWNSLDDSRLFSQRMLTAIKRKLWKLG